MKPSRSRSYDGVFARLDKDMTHDVSDLVVDRPPDEPSVAPRERRPWTGWLGPFIVTVLGVVAVGIVVSAIAVVSREPFGPTGAVIPPRPVTTPAPPPASSAEPSPPPAT